MDKQLSKVRKKFTAIAISLAVFCVILGSTGVYLLAESRLNSQINTSKINSLTSNDPAVSKYLASQQPYHAHFETIAAAIQRDNKQQLTRSLPLIIFIASLTSGLFGWILSRRLLVPVKDSFVSQRRFMQDAAHELRNPLAALKTMVQQARRKPPKDEPLKKFLRAIDGQLDHLNAITTDLLLLERREYPGTESTDIVPLVNDVLEELHHLATRKKVVIIRKMPESLVTTIDPHHFLYMAKNVIENAIKFSSVKKPVIYIYLKPRPEGWMLEVKDNGIGIPSEDVASITQRFYRAQNAASIEGTGLGMAIVAKFVNIYKGSLNVSSQTGHGTSVSIEI